MKFLWPVRRNVIIFVPNICCGILECVWTTVVCRRYLLLTTPWSGGVIKERLDTTICNEVWAAKFPSAALVHEQHIQSYHRPIPPRYGVLCHWNTQYKHPGNMRLGGLMRQPLMKLLILLGNAPKWRGSTLHWVIALKRYIMISINGIGYSEES